MRQRSGPAIPDDAAVVDDLLKLGSGGAALSGCQVCLSACINVVEAGKIGGEPYVRELKWRDRFREAQRGRRVLLGQRDLCLNCRQPKRLNLRSQRTTFPQVL